MENLTTWKPEVDEKIVFVTGYGTVIEDGARVIAVDDRHALVQMSDGEEQIFEPTNLDNTWGLVTPGDQESPRPLFMKEGSPEAENAIAWARKFWEGFNLR